MSLITQTSFSRNKSTQSAQSSSRQSKTASRPSVSTSAPPHPLWLSPLHSPTRTRSVAINCSNISMAVRLPISLFDLSTRSQALKLCLSSPKLAFSTHKMPNFIVKIIFGFVIRIRYSDPFFNEYDTNTNRQKINELKRITIRIRHSAGSWTLHSGNSSSSFLFHFLTRFFY